MSKTNIRCYLNLVKDNFFSLDEKNELLKEMQNIKLMDYNFSTTRVDASLELFDTGYVESLYVEDIVLQVFDKIKFYFPDFKDFCTVMNFNVIRIEVVINIHNNHSPSIFLNKEIICFLNEQNIEIEFDMYSF